MARLKINSRKSWGARRPRPRSKQNIRSIREFFLHYPASPHDLDHLDRNREQDQFMRDIQAFHMGPQRNFADFAYNFAVFQDGQVFRGRGIEHIPAGQLGHNTNTIAVLCVVGVNEKPTERMIRSIIDLKDFCDRKTGRDLRVLGHGQGPGQNTQCPGPHVRAIVGRIGRH